MIVQSFKYAGWPVLFACASAVACSKTPATQTVFVNADLGGSGALCPQSGANVLQVGNMTPGNLPETIPEGQSGTNINCTVSPSGDGFNLMLDASQPGSEGGEIIITGHVTAADTGNKVTAQFVSQMAGASYQSSDCDVTYVYFGSPIPPNERVTPGSFFGHVSCTNATTPNGGLVGQQVHGPDGGIINAVCDGEADVLFQNCDQ